MSAPTWNVGDELQGQTLSPLTREQLRKYAEASGDFNPIHLEDGAAEAADLPGVIAHGMLTVATMGRLFSAHLQHGHVKTFRSRFSGMVFPGDVLKVGGHATGVEETAVGRLYTFAVHACRGDDTVASGEVGFLIPHAPTDNPM